MSFASLASGASYTWDGNGTTTPNPAGGSGTWSTSIANWWDGTQNLVWPSSGTDNDAVFANTAGTVTVAAGGVTVNDLTFAITGYNVSGGPLTLNATSGTAPTVAVATTVSGQNQDATIGSNLSGSFGLRKTGDGMLFLTGSNSGLTGPLVISGVASGNTGGVRFQSTAAFGGFTSVDISGNGHLSLVSTTVGSTVSILAAGGGGAAPGGTIRAHAGSSVIDGTIQLQDGNVRISAVYNPTVASTLTINGAITAPAASGRGLNFRLGQDNGVVITNTANYWEGITYVSEGVVYAFPGALPSASNLSIANSNSAWFETNGTFSRAIGTSAGQVQFANANTAGLSARGGDLTVNLGGAGATMMWGATGFSPSVLGLNSPTSTGRLTFSNPINLNGATRTVRVDKNVADLAGALTGAGAGLTKTGTGTLQLSALNSYSGTTTISAGILRVGNGSTAGTLGTGPVVNNAALIFSRSDDYGGAVSNAISGTGSVTVAGGTLTLSASNSFTGATAINAGTLLVNDANALAGTGTISFGGGVLRYSANNAVDYSSLIVNSGSSIAIDTGGRSITFGSALASSNSGGLVKLGSGVLVLLGSNAYTGATTITSGTLQVGSINAIRNSSSVGIADGAFLQYSGAADTLNTAITVTSGTGTVTNSGGQTLTLGGTLTKNGTVLRLTGGSFNVTGQIVGSSSNSDLYVDGASVMLLNTNNNYVGPTYVYGGGTLVLGASNVIPTNSALTLGGTGSDTGTGTINTGLFSDTIASLTSSSLGSTVSITGSGATMGGLTTSGNVTFGAGTDTLALTISSSLTLGKYQLLTYQGLLSGTFDTVSGLTDARYNLVYGSGSNSSIDLQMRATQAAALPYTQPTSGTVSAFVSTNVSFSGTLANTTPTGGATLAVSLTGTGGQLTVGSLAASTGSAVAAGSAATITGQIATGTTLGSRLWTVVNTDTSALTSTTATASGVVNVFAHGTPTLSGTTINLGNVLVGSTASQLLTVSNGTLNSPAGNTGGITWTASSTPPGFGTGGLNQPGVVASGSGVNYTYGLVTGSAGSFTGSQTFTFADDTSILGGGSLGGLTVSLTGTVYDPATASLASGGSMAGNAWTINLGEFNQGTGTSTPWNFSISNLLASGSFTADLMLSSFALTGDSGAIFMDLTGTSFTTLAAGQANPFTAWISLANTGTFTNTYQLNFTSAKDNQVLGGSQNVTLTVTGIIVVPEPQTAMLAVFGAALAGWQVWTRKRLGMIRDGR